jgi:hypothetical protein
MSPTAAPHVLENAVRDALARHRPRHGLIAAGLVLAPLAAGAFPPVMDLSDLLPANGGTGTAGFALTGTNRSDQSGRSVSHAGDVNGDGVADVLVGVPYGDPDGRQTAGETYVVFGRTTGFPPELALASLYSGDGSAGFVVTGIDHFDYSGRSVGAAGDVNGDGIDDLIIGAYKAYGTDVENYAGQAYVVFGRKSPFPARIELAHLLPENGGDGSAGFVIDAVAVYDYAGDSVAGAGDVNGDGFDDVLVGARYASPGGRHHAGAAYVVFGRATLPPVIALADLLPGNGGDGSAGFALHGVDPGDLATVSYAGQGVSGAGDVNGDGVDDLIVGASGADPGDSGYAGESYVVFGRQAPFPAVIELSALRTGDGSIGFVLDGIGPQDFSGGSVSGAGDVNGDGIGDLLVGAAGAGSAGEAYVVFGRASGFDSRIGLASLLAAGGGDGSRGFVLHGFQASAGASVSGAGDVNGDGVDDLVVGDPAAHFDAGQVYVVLGRTAGFPAEFELDSLLPSGQRCDGFVLNGLPDSNAGTSVSAAGDVNGDGLGDVLFGYNKGM